MHSDDPPTLANSIAVRVELLCSMMTSSRAEPERIARQLQRDAIVAAEAQFRRGIELALGNVGREFDIARDQHVARHRDDGGARGDLAGRRLHRDVAAVPGDVVGRRRQRERHIARRVSRSACRGPGGSRSRRCDPARAPCRSRRRPSDPCRWHWRRARIPPSPPSRRGPSAARRRRTHRPCRARRRRWRGWRAPGRQETPRFRRPARCGGRCGFSGPRATRTMSSPALRASLTIGLVSGLCSQRAPRSNGTSNVVVSVRQRPPIWPDASTTITLRFAAMIRRAAAMPAAPAPITTMSASRGNGAA